MAHPLPAVTVDLIIRVEELEVLGGRMEEVKALRVTTRCYGGGGGGGGGGYYGGGGGSPGIYNGGGGAGEGLPIRRVRARAPLPAAAPVPTPAILTGAAPPATEQMEGTHIVAAFPARPAG